MLLGVMLGACRLGGGKLTIWWRILRQVELVVGTRRSGRGARFATTDAGNHLEQQVATTAAASRFVTFLVFGAPALR